MPKAFWILSLSCFLLAQAVCCQAPCDNNSLSIRIKKGREADLNLLCSCDSLEVLDLSRLAINTLPSCIFDLPALEKLNLSKTGIRELPSAILKMEKLEVLNLSNTALEILPEELAHLSNLRTLILKGTQVNVLPSGLDQLQKIDMRYIDFTREEQRNIRAQYPNAEIFLSSPCHCN